jgi:hypothetical protein
MKGNPLKTVTDYSQLVTSKESTLAGFIEQSETKIAKSKAFKLRIDSARSKIVSGLTIGEIFADSDTKYFFLGASCLSKKAQGHFREDELETLVSKVIDLNRLGDLNYVDELSSRCLLTLGDSLGGTMRNSVGQAAQLKFTTTVASFIESAGLSVNFERNRDGKITGLEWLDLRMIFDKKPGFINKSVDFIVHDRHTSIEDPTGYISCGELKGGIDPAGADEHWKTAKTALERIRVAFAEQKQPTPGLFFVANAIEVDMAKEILADLNNGFLSGAANLNCDDQLEEVVKLITNLR